LAACTSKSVPAAQNELFLVDRIRSGGSDSELQAEIVQIFSKHQEDERKALAVEQTMLQREMKRWQQEDCSLAEVEERLAHETPRLAQVQDELVRLVE
jgi:hypothetical protein